MLHPSIVLLSWGALLVFAQLAVGATAIASAALLVVLAGLAAHRRLGLLLRRSRYLMLALFGVFAWATPGHLVWPMLHWASPTHEGVSLALTHALRLTCVLAMVAILLEKMSEADLVAALIGLSWPLGVLGLDRPRAALRLTLVLRYTAQARARWRDWLDDATPASAQDDLAVELAPRALRPLDWAALVMLVALIGWGLS